MVNIKILLGVTVIAMLALSAGVAWADEVTSAIDYQGELADSAGGPLSGTYTMTFRLYEAATGGAALDTDIRDVVVTNGSFNTEIDFDQSYFDGRALWLGIKVGTDPEMTPRQEFRPVPYALSLVPGARIMGAAQWNLNVETTHASGRALRGQASATSGTNYGVVGVSRSPDGYGGYFYNNKGGVGVYGKGGKYGGYFDGKVYVRDNVGIGTTNPGAKLDVNGAVKFQMADGGAQTWFPYKNGEVYITSDLDKSGNGDIHLRTFSDAKRYQDKMLIEGNTGNVGIGTKAPKSKLDVSGDVSISGNLGTHGYSPKPITAGWGGGIHTWDVEAEGTMWSRHGYQSGPRDLAENYLSDMELEPGDVVCLDTDEDRIVLTDKPNDILVIGVISTEPGLLLGVEHDIEKEKVFPVALCGRVPCKVVDENGPIKRGDLLTSSSIPGHAMKAKPITIDEQEFFRPGTIIGKALGSLESEKGVVDIFVSLM